MKRITFNRCLIAMVLIFLPVSFYGSMKSAWDALQFLFLLAYVMYLGFIEGRASQEGEHGR